MTSAFQGLDTYSLGLEEIESAPGVHRGQRPIPMEWLPGVLKPGLGFEGWGVVSDGGTPSETMGRWPVPPAYVGMSMLTNWK